MGANSLGFSPASDTVVLGSIGGWIATCLGGLLAWPPPRQPRGEGDYGRFAPPPVSSNCGGTMIPSRMRAEKVGS